MESGSGTRNEFQGAKKIKLKGFSIQPLFSLLLLVTLLLFTNSIQVKATSSQSTAILNVETQIAVESLTPTVNTSISGNGEFSVTFDFLVEGNVDQIKMFVEVTDFYKVEDLTGLVISPIPVLTSSGVEIDPQDAIPIPVGIGRNAAFIGTGDPIESFPSHKTETLTFQSGTPLTFNDPVAVTATWDQDEPQKPAGQYLAKVKFTCMASPE